MTTLSAPTPAETSESGLTSAPKRRPLERTRRWITRSFAVVGVLAVVGVSAGVVNDYLDFDRTSGGYEAPYTGWTGTPIDWSVGSVSATGIHKDGTIVDIDVNCTTGMVSFSAFGQSVDWRKLSARAIAIHKPREACQDAGFSPEF